MYFSIIIPCYRSEQTLGRTIHSILAQGPFLKEILLIDDGSPDNTAAVAQQFAAQHPDRIRFQGQSNQGPAAARNLGASLAMGAYTIFLDADDTLCPGALEAFHHAFQHHPDTAVLVAGYRAIHSEHTKARHLKPYPNRTALVRAMWFGEFSINGGMVALRTSLLNHVRYPENIRHGEDIVFFSHVIAQYDTEILPILSVNIHHHADSLRHQHASILKDQDALIALLFNPAVLPRELMALEGEYHAYKLISLARTSLQLGDKPLARRYLKQAFHLYPPSFMRSKTIKILLKAAL